MAFDDGVKTVSGSIAHTEDAATKVPFVSVKCGIEPTLTGKSEVVCVQTGKNLFDKNSVEDNTWIIVNSTDTEATVSYRTSGYIPVKANTRYFVTEKWSNRTAYYDRNKNGIAYLSFSGGAFTCLYDGYIRITIKNDIDLDTFIVNEGNTAITYEPYNGTTHTANLGRTIYGGTADIVNGVGTDSGVKYTLDGTQAVAMFSTTDTNVKRFSVSIPSDSITTTTDRTDIISDVDILPTTTNAVTSAGGNGIHYRTNGSHNIIVCFGTDVPLSSVEEYNAYVSEHNIEIVYTLATPTDFTFTPITPTPETVGKVNNVYCNTGNTELTYHDNAHGFAEVTVNKTGKNVRQNVTDYSSANPVFFQYRNYYSGAKCGYPRLTGLFKAGTYTLSFDTDYSGFESNRVCAWAKKPNDDTYYNLSSNGDLVSPTQQGYQNWCSISSGHVTGTFKINEDCESFGFGYYKYNTSVPYTNLMLEVGSTATEYVEPTTPVSKTAYLHKVIYGGTADVVRGTCEPKNLIQLYTRASNNGVDYSINEDGSLHRSGLATANSYNNGNASSYENCPYKFSAGTYTITVSGSTTESDYVSFGIITKSGTSMSAQNVYGNSSKTFTINEDFGAWYWCKISSGVTVDDNVYIWLEKGSSSTEYTPYFEPFTFPPISIGTDEGENTLFANEGDSAITYRKAVD